ncbi:methyltransferase [Leishmania donovani]|uniref:Cap-specific mRNA (nucleoside-2'-O-)-methyltransferase 1 n=3 Tax=Leishmania donovani species complex TaxID=38574 RepID=A0A6L0XVJ2_LEIIN|nr:ensangp00000010174-like protein [Leishmania infantum JPCM5]XP_003865808.1 methyltransferase, putative [Leishmania donovani]CAC9553390.1 methyltransferase_-_putative [Leishmania infantum]AYU84103.1 methyltransferase, putative [Leishmania donovani]TPP49474.1 FtsJ-like methyltransferase family protein [Leishmania donovani]TPP53358.1 FtsJ-like methyltransferase family protein [Leishmania donovani]CAJ1994083.1 methyltransferase [Leishmania donovani]|eukprot:XP_003392849.1 ensangp00000010174-like protein [Leishmania infantum JPCM5]
MKKTVEDRSLEFLIRRGNDAELPPLASLSCKDFKQHHWRDAFDDEQAALREQLWAVKTQLDVIPAETYTATRNKLFPLAVSGEQRNFSNRAGHKLLESMESTGVWMELSKLLRGKSKKRPRDFAFADVCGGPGAFSQALFQAGRKQGWRQLHGYGMTLAGVSGLDWYAHLLKSPQFTCTYGLDGTGDIFKLSNIECLVSITKAAPMLLVVADGGFNVDFSVANYQETISSRIMYGQWLAALKLLRNGGCFVLKLFDTFSPLSRAVLYLSCCMYRRVHIAKPRHSRVVNSERYLVCVDFLGSPSEGWSRYLDCFYEVGFVDNEHVPELIPREWCLQDAVFMADVREMNTAVATNQVIALQMILDAAPAMAEELKAKRIEKKPAAGSDDGRTPPPAEGEDVE